LLRRRPHSSKADLPTDMTRYLCRGENNLRLYVLVSPRQAPYADNDGLLAEPHVYYAAVVERVIFAQLKNEAQATAEHGRDMDYVSHLSTKQQDQYASDSDRVRRVVPQG
jgi:hypothetical protein